MHIAYIWIKKHTPSFFCMNVFLRKLKSDSRHLDTIQRSIILVKVHNDRVVLKITLNFPSMD